MLAESRIIPLRRGDRRCRWLCIPGAGASVTSLLPLAQRLEGNCEVFGLQPRGLDSRLPPHATVEGAAGSALLELQSEFPHGELHLLGHSFGGWVAFEMACRLQALGREIASLTIIDSESPVAQAPPRPTRDGALHALVELYDLTLERPLGICPRDIDGKDLRYQVGLLHARLVANGLMPVRSSPDALRGILTCFESAHGCRYLPAAVYRGPVTLIVAQTMCGGPGATESQDDMVVNWRRYAPELSPRIAPGNHMTLLRSPNVDVVGLIASRPLPAHAPGPAAASEIEWTPQ